MEFSTALAGPIKLFHDLIYFPPGSQIGGGDHVAGRRIDNGKD